eukprot:TRINITY_DN9196_c0_g1_i4.p1 TRINITY_DN9196_c0_g1~~TRINITY_DN9196_c0_g1_i4.p1  ORF type:complete len:332 (-),score=39.94 TRINITY_DN9196_c0_g1_i4:359-1354(-)
MGGCYSANARVIGEERIPNGDYPAPLRKVASAVKLDRDGRIPMILGSHARDVHEDYNIGREVGRGLFGVTRIAIQRGTGTEFACKTISKKSKSSSQYDSMIREMQILNHLQDAEDMVARLFEAYEHSDCIHLILHFCEGGTLYSRVTEGSSNGMGRPMPEREAARILEFIVRIVDTLHAKRVMHRDIKLENFMFDTASANSRLLAIDFGLATFFEPGQRFSEIVGSAYYVAPEVLCNDYGPECDVWSIGVILYMMLSGEPPFFDVSEKGICDKVLKGEYRLEGRVWNDISLPAKNLIRRILEQDPAKRITCRQILEHEWMTTMLGLVEKEE